MAAIAGAAAGASSIVYKAVPDHATSGISSGLERLFGTPTSSKTVSRENSGSSVLGQGQELETSTGGKRRKARASDDVHRELDEYLEDPLETFSRIERVEGVEKRVVFDLLTFWQVRAILSISCQWS